MWGSRSLSAARSIKNPGQQSAENGIPISSNTSCHEHQSRHTHPMELLRVEFSGISQKSQFRKISTTFWPAFGEFFLVTFRSILSILSTGSTSYTYWGKIKAQIKPTIFKAMSEAHSAPLRREARIRKCDSCSLNTFRSFQKKTAQNNGPITSSWWLNQPI